jgi:acyl-coenzyme A thioesterase PaaI-like protein
MDLKNIDQDKTAAAAEQDRMDAAIKAAVDVYLKQQANSINGMMQPEFVECSFEEKTLKMAFPVLEWEKNRIGVMHGGSIAAAFDIATGLLARFLSGENFTPTIQLETVFIRPIPIGDVFVVHIKTNLAGRKLTHLYCEGFVKSTGKLAATATCSYFNENTNVRTAAE